MNPRCSARRFWGVVLGLCVCWAAVGAWAQERGTLIFPPAAAGTAESAFIESQAVYMAAYGNMRESLAYARKVNAEAVAIEIQNSIAYVDAFFKRRELNREWRLKENPNYLMNEQRRQEVLKKRMKEQYQDLLKSDVTDGLNWLVRELSGPTLACRYLPPEQRLSHSEYDTKLAPNDFELICLTDGGSKGSQMVFRLAAPQPLETRWPLGLRDPAFADGRKEFEAARDEVLKESQANKGPASPEASMRLLQAVNNLIVQLNDEYPRERRANPNEFLAYSTSKQYLASLASGAHRVLTTNDRSLFEGGFKFQGESVVDLIQHMCEHGMLFARPQPGGEGVYRKVFEGMRNLYLAVGSADGAGGPNDRRGPPPAAGAQAR